MRDAALPAFPVLRSVRSSVLMRNAADETFLSRAEGDARSAGAVLLLSGSEHECARVSMLCSRPAAVFRMKDDGIRMRTARGDAAFRMNPLDALDALLGGTTDPNPGRPGLLAGYFAYDLKNSIERLPRHAVDAEHLPDVYLVLPTRLLLHDRAEGLLTEQSREYTIGGETLPAIDPEETVPEGPLASLDIEDSTFSRDAYMAAVEEARRRIRDGEVYQLNLSQQYSGRIHGDPWKYWTSLFAANPAPYYAWINTGDHQVLSTSMERFISKRGNEIETRPIKGTRPRGATPEEDARAAFELLHSAKDDAELSMIVDLLRNDLSRICLPGSVKIAGHKKLESWKNVHHLVSVIRGSARSGCGAADVLRAAFPGGSITGCPRIRAMELLDSFEPASRHIYTGSIGWISTDGDMELSIAIRTMAIHGGAFRLSLGGGIVYASDPASEYEETLAKGAAFFGARTEAFDAGSSRGGGETTGGKVQPRPASDHKEP